MVKGDIKYSSQVLIAEGTAAETIEKGDIIVNTGGGWVVADAVTLATSNVIGVAFEDADVLDNLSVFRSGVIEVEKASGIAAVDGELVEVSSGVVWRGQTDTANASIINDAEAADITAWIRIW